ncbi:hypothetical protein, partial [Halorubrum sp. SP9]|uniref:hypothetical protein n=1 Tax=Halorubrum sp. SP9 TaxID=1537267 RepID=UPI001A7E1B04
QHYLTLTFLYPQPKYSGMSGRTLYHDEREQDTEMTPPDNAATRRSDLQERYSFYILNPEYRENVEYQLWINDQYGDEYPVVSSSTLDQATFFSQDQGVGDSINLTEDFFDALAAVIHNRCGTSTTKFRTRRQLCGRS